MLCLLNQPGTPRHSTTMWLKLEFGCIRLNPNTYCQVSESELGAPVLPQACRAPSSEVTVARSVLRDTIPASLCLCAHCHACTCQGLAATKVWDPENKGDNPTYLAPYSACLIAHEVLLKPSFPMTLLLSTCITGDTNPHSSGITDQVRGNYVSKSVDPDRSSRPLKARSQSSTCILYVISRSLANKK